MLKYLNIFTGDPNTQFIIILIGILGIPCVSLFCNKIELKSDLFQHQGDQSKDDVEVLPDRSRSDTRWEGERDGVRGTPPVRVSVWPAGSGSVSGQV